MSYFSIHNHTDKSNIRLIDCINKPKDLINRAIDIGLKGLAITDHECLSAHIEVKQYADKIKEKYPDFKIAYGNEIYLTKDRTPRQKYYHLILIAKDDIGYRQLRELSSTAWYHMYNYAKMDRVPTLYSELKEVVEKNKGHLICTTACRGSELGIQTWNLINGDEEAHNKIVQYMLFLKDLFGEDFYIECAPHDDEEQIAINKRYKNVAKAFNVKMVYATDSHYLKKEDRYIHESYLNSKDGDREVGAFYSRAYMMTPEEAKELLRLSFDDDFIDEMTKNTLEVMNKIGEVNFYHKQKIPQIDDLEVPKLKMDISLDDKKYSTLNELLKSSNVQNRYWINECLNVLYDKKLLNETYLDRLEIEADVINFIGEKLDQHLFAYFNTMKYYIELFWECGSIVGPGRGSSTGFLSNWLLGITQLDPIQWKLEYWRFLNKERAELPDIDVDLSPLVRPLVLKKVRQERGEKNCLLVATFGTEGTRSAILTACRGYRSEDYPQGIDNDVGQYLSSMIPSERGFLWSLHDVVYGNPEKDRQPSRAFINEVNKYPGLLDIMMGIEGLCNKRSSHASGVILYDDLYDTGSLMRTPQGELITAYSLHDAEYAGDTKYDWLLTEACAKITYCLELLQKNGEIEQDLTLKEMYNKYIHPTVLDTNNPKIWDALANGEVLQVFQFSTGVGLDTAISVKPQSPLDMTACNALMRLMASEKGGERPLERYIRMKNNIDLWYKEMRDWKLTEEQIKILEPHYLEYYGCVATQEQMMLVLMDKNIANFTLSESNSARKIVAKKLMDKIPELRELMYSKISDKNFADYVWETAIKPSLGYSFSINHSLPYSFVGIQEIELATRFSPVYWNTSCLCINAGTLEEKEDEFDNEEDEDKKNKTVDYNKIARAIGEIRQANINIVPPLINSANKDFEPDVENNRILYSLKALSGVGDKEIEEIVDKRPFNSLSDYLDRTKIKKTATVSLIKSGAFDELEHKDRKEIMKDYIKIISESKKVLNMRNFQALMRNDLFPKEAELDYQCRLFEFNRYIRQKHFKKDDILLLDSRAQDFMLNNYPDFYDTAEIYDNNLLSIKEKAWKKVYDKDMLKAKEYIKKNQEWLLDNYNNLLFKNVWQQYAVGNISKWEMDSMSFYYHKHELADINLNKYGISEFSQLPEEPEIERFFEIKGRQIPIYKIRKIVGTCIGKNPTRGSFTLLTSDGEVVDIKLTNEHFAYYNKQISEKNSDGTKKVKEKSWFTRGTKLMVVGIRRGSGFMAKKYKNTGGHRLYKITDVINNGTEMLLSSSRYGAEE